MVYPFGSIGQLLNRLKWSFFLSTELSIGIKGVGRLAVYLFVDFQNESITILCEPLLSGHYHLSSAHIRAIICLMTHTHTHKYTHQC